MYDWWPSYKAGTLLYNQIWGNGSWTEWEVLDAASTGLLFAGRGLQALMAVREAAYAEQLGLLRDAGSKIGNFSVGAVDTIADSNAPGKAWVGPGYRVSESGRAWLSTDGTKIYRPPTMKPAWGEYQANFMRIDVETGRALSNAHLTIRMP